ncbi:MAG: hypothetical protein H6722_33005 [Sandaracinus sp.]|nr:hypothetical protein [Sandaracinus sp.]
MNATRLVAMRVGVGMLVVGLATAAAAQPAATPTESDAARDAFVAGAEAAEQQLWADSERHFARAYALSGVPAALFNRAVALRNLGREREARDAFDEVMRAGVDEPTRVQATRLRDEAAARVVTVVVVGLDATAEHEIEVDGERRGDSGVRPLRLEVDPGTHVIELHLAGHRSHRWRGVVAAGEVVTVRAELEPIAPRRRRGWIAAVVGVAVGAAGLALGVGLARRDVASPVPPMSDLVLRVD